MSIPNFMFTFIGGRPVLQFTHLGAVTSHSFTVPAGKRWLVFGGEVERDANAALSLYVYNAADELIMVIFSEGAGVAEHDWGVWVSSTPTESRSISHPILLGSGDYLKVVWGAAQTTPVVTIAYVECAD